MATSAHVTTEVDRERATAVLLLAFSSDPAFRWVYPDPQAYIEHFPVFMQAFGGAAFDSQTAFSVGDYAGAALWLPPGIQPNEEALVAIVETTIAADVQEDVFGVLERFGQYHPSEPHWYLPLIGVDPNKQGNGYGSDLLSHALATCDRDGLPAYLESSNPRNISLYERHGFERLGTIQVGSSPTFCPMLRRPRTES